MRHVLRCIVAVIALWAVAADSVFAQSATTTTQTQQQPEPAKKPSLLLSYLERTEVWTGAGDINSVASGGWDGSWWAIQLKRQFYKFDDGSALKLFVGYEEYTGDVTVPLDPKLKLGKSTTYRGVGDSILLGIEYNHYFDGWLDLARVNGVLGNEFGANTTGYRQNTDFTAVDLLVGTVSIDHDRRWFSETDIMLHYRRQLTADKDSSFRGKALSDPADSHSAWDITAAVDAFAIRSKNGRSRFALGPFVQHSHVQSDGSDRELLALRVRYMYRTTPIMLTMSRGIDDGNLPTGRKFDEGTLFIFDVEPYYSVNTGVDDFRGILFGLSFSF